MTVARCAPCVQTAAAATGNRAVTSAPTSGRRRSAHRKHRAARGGIFSNRKPAPTFSGSAVAGVRRGLPAGSLRSDGLESSGCERLRYRVARRGRRARSAHASLHRLARVSSLDLPAPFAMRARAAGVKLVRVVAIAVDHEHRPLTAQVQGQDASGTAAQLRRVFERTCTSTRGDTGRRLRTLRRPRDGVRPHMTAQFALLGSYRRRPSPRATDLSHRPALEVHHQRCSRRDRGVE
jgi:hypothetical protein